MNQSGDTPRGPDFVPLPEDPFAGGRSDDAPPRARPAHPGQPPAPPAPPASADDAPSEPQGPPVDHAGRPAICPYCAAELTNTVRCEACRGMLDPLSRQASQNSMGPWAIREAQRATGAALPGCSFETLRALILRGKVTAATVLRGPTTRQFWMRADHAPGVAVYLGVCHACKADVPTERRVCEACGVELHVAPEDRQHLGLSPITALPGSLPTTDLVRTGAPGDGPSAVSRELRHLRRRSRNLALLVAAMGVMLIGLSSVVVWRELENRGVKVNLPGGSDTPARSTAPPPGASSTAANPGAQAPGPGTPSPPTTTPEPETGDAGDAIHPALVGLGPELDEWRPDLERAAELEAAGDLASLERASQLVERALAEATRAGGDQPLLASWLTRLRERADRLYAEDLLGG